jgi:hypothetical protein
MHWRGRSAKLPRRVCTEIAPGDADRAHVSDAVSDVTARSAATEDAADCVGEFWFPWDTAGLIEASEVPSACADDNSITNRCFAHEDRRRGLQPASAHTSATMWGWDTMAPRRVGIIPGGIPASSARLPAEDAAEAVARIEAVAIDGRVNVGRPAHASGETAWDLLPCRGLPHASTCCFIHAVQRSVIVTRRIRCAACKEAATPNKLYVAIYGTESLHLRRSSSHRAHTDLPVWTGSPRLGPRAYGALPHGSQPTLKIADKY